MNFTITDHLSLRTVEQSDAAELFTVTDASRDYLREWLPWLDATKEVSDTAAYIDSCINGYKEKSSLSVVIIFNGKIVGIAGFNHINYNNKIASIGYWLSEDAQGHGIMSQTVHTLMQYAFDELKLNKIEIRAAAENAKSRAIPERLNFIEEGTIRAAEWLYDHYVDHVIFGMLASEWAQTPTVQS